MTVAELIAQLKKLPQDAQVFCWQKSFLGEAEGTNRIYRSMVDSCRVSQKNPMKVFLDGE